MKLLFRQFSQILEMEVNSVVKSRRGSMLVESAIILPLVIFSLIAIVFMMITMYEITAQTAYFHSSLRYESGVLSKTYYLFPSSFSVTNPSIHSKPLYSELDNEMKISRNNYIFLGDFSMEFKGKAYCINEEDIIRAVRR